jgi:hypothetical protein
MFAKTRSLSVMEEEGLTILKNYVDISINFGYTISIKNKGRLTVDEN